MKKVRTKEMDLLAAIPDEEIDFSDIPETTDWSGSLVGKFYRPIKQSVTLRLDADVVDWLRRDGKGYQTRINHLLRREMDKRKQAA
ncbi:MAG: BrnA antitoxin family protein [Deltaproteobacteria bacterium]